MNLSSAPPRRLFAITARSAQRGLASSAYFPPKSPHHPSPSSPSSSSTPPSATTSSPDLSAEDKQLIASIVRVDQAGELGANWIYRGQKYGSLLRGDHATAKQVEGMWENEKHHLNTMSIVRAQHDVRPTILYPVWQAMAFGLGVGTALMGKQAAMACTEAVETVIGEHYDE